jgi:hypothetical protein
VQRLFVPGEHGVIYKNRELLRTLADLLVVPTVLRGVPAHLQLVVREDVVEPREPIYAMITFDELLNDFAGWLTVERVNTDPDTGAVLGIQDPLIKEQVTYKGADIAALTVVVEAPEVRGVYRVSFRDEFEKEPSGFDQVIVQSKE